MITVLQNKLHLQYLSVSSIAYVLSFRTEIACPARSLSQLFARHLSFFVQSYTQDGIKRLTNMNFLSQMS